MVAAGCGPEVEEPGLVGVVGGGAEGVQVDPGASADEVDGLDEVAGEVGEAEEVEGAGDAEVGGGDLVEGVGEGEEFREVLDR